MKYKMLGIAVSFLLLLTGCAPVAVLSPKTASPTAGRTATPQPAATRTVTPLPSSPPTPSLSPSPRPNCLESAVFVADVTVADNTRMKAGQPFTKTWQMLNAGTCAWDAGYTLHFLSGNRMNSPDSVPLAVTAPNATLNLSVDLTAPARDGVFTALYEIRNPQGKPIPIGLTKSMWVKIMVGNVVVADEVEPTSTTVPGGVAPTARAENPSEPCQPQRSGAGLIDLINNARQAAGLRVLNENAKLNAAAQAHSDDMACNDIFSHTGSNGSSIQDRIVASGYGASDWGEIIYASGSAQQAFNWWMSDGVHHDMILNPNMKDIGAGYTYVEGSAYGGYFTVDFGVP